MEGAEDMTLAMILKNLGFAYLKIGNFEEHVKKFAKSFAIQNRIKGVDSIESTRFYLNPE